MNQALEWLRDHPLVWELLLFPLVTFIATALFKPRSPEEYAALGPRLGALLKLIGAIGWDAPKLVEAARQLATGQSRSVSEERRK